MRSRTAALAAALALLIDPARLLAQSSQSSQPPTSTSVPRLVTISGTYRPAAGQKAAGGERVEVVTLAIYADETGGEPLWQETQNVVVDASGKYSLLLGATAADGVPLDVFATGQARWLGMVWSWPGEADAARVRLTSVPYALRASDAATLGGKPASAFLLAPSAGGQTTAGGSTTEAITMQAVLPGTTNVLAKYVNGVDVGNSAVYESGGFVGINTTNPFDVIHARFNNTNGGLTGIAVQNLGSSASSYSGMLFYDHTGALGQFQGYNNSTREYRIHNVGSGGSINFMLGGVSRFHINDQGHVGLGFSGGPERLMVAGSIRATGEVKLNGNQAFGIQWLDPVGGGLQAHMHRFGAVDNRLYVTNAGINNLVGVYLAVGGTSWTSSSDERLKTNIAPLTGILDKIKDIRVVSFDMASLAVDEKTGKAAVNRETPKRVMKNGTLIKQQIGSIAQDWLANFPELVVEPTSDDQYYGLDYDRIGVVALGAVKELNAVVTKKDAEIKELSAVLTKQDAEVKALNERLAALEQMLQQLKAELERRQPKQE